MTTIKTLLVDDEYLALNLLETFIENIPDLTIIGKAKTGIEALEILHTTTVDLLFLDIQMPILSGNSLLRTLKNPPVTIFTTAYSEYAIEAFDLNAIDYLLKPFSFERFLQAVNKAKEQLVNRQESKGSLLNPPFEKDTEREKAFFTIKVDGRLQKIVLTDILFIEGLKEYVRIHCSKKRYVTLESLKNLELSLPEEQFLRVHKSFIIAKDKVEALEGNLLEIQQHKIPISRGKREEVRKAIFG